MPQDECKGGDCPLRPQFDDGAEQAPATTRKVRLSTSKYVQLLIDARETDPDCWPPGLEAAAGLIESARGIEEACIDRWGEFDPAKLSRAQSRKYFEIQLALDTLQESAGDQPLDIQGALSEARHALDAEDLGAGPAAPEPAAPSELGLPAHAPLPEMPSGEGFFARIPAGAAGTAAEAAFFTRRALSGDHAEARTLLLADGWVEMPPLQRGDNYA